MNNSLETATRASDVRDKTGGNRPAAVLLGGCWLLMTLAFAPFYAWPLALVCLVPFLICILRRPMNWRWTANYYLFGAAFFVLNLWWLWQITIGGALALALFVALYFPLFAWGFFRLVKHANWPAMAAAPVAWTAVEYMRSTFLSGFAWFDLGNALTPAKWILQTADLFGVWGLTFFCAMSAGLVVDILRLPLVASPRLKTQDPRLKPEGKKFNPTIKRLFAIYLAIVVFLAGYGIFRLRQQPITPGPRIAVIQENIPQSIKDSPDLPAKHATFEKFLKLSQAALAQNPDLIAWPETMVPGYINPEMLALNPEDYKPETRAYLEDCRGYDRALSAFACENHVQLLVGAESLIPGPLEDLSGNTAVQYGTGGRQIAHYAKRHLVMFGEYVPLKDELPWLHNLLLKLTPYSADYSVTPGNQWSRFSLPFDHAEARFGVPICYEDAMPEPARGFAQPREREGRKKGVDFLISISNDGWYETRFELEQHLQECQVRAVENRVPIARSVNGGNSGFVDSCGRVVKLVRNPAGQSRFVAGYAVAAMPLDARISLYSRIGDVLPLACGAIGVLGVGWTIVKKARKKK